tara:strand:+ start:835 stop:1242 length:408 start_codon:yes stop_codon:yes gene_type:complete
MSKKKIRIYFNLFSFIVIICLTFTSFNPGVIYALDNDNSVFIKKVSKAYTKKFCNAVGFGLSKESAMNFSFEENKKVYEKRKEMNHVNKELLAEEIAYSVVDQCGYRLNLSGEKDILEFKNYYLSKDKQSEIKQN